MSTDCRVKARIVGNWQWAVEEKRVGNVESRQLVVGGMMVMDSSRELGMTGKKVGCRQSRELGNILLEAGEEVAGFWV